jgi:hypothetical protein
MLVFFFLILAMPGVASPQSKGSGSCRVGIQASQLEAELQNGRADACLDLYSSKRTPTTVSDLVHHEAQS